MLMLLIQTRTSVRQIMAGASNAAATLLAVSHAVVTRVSNWLLTEWRVLVSIGRRFISSLFSIIKLLKKLELSQ